MSEEIKNMSKKILLAEDDVLLSRIFKERLIEEGYDVVRVADGERVLEAMEKEHFDLLLLDLLMPKMNGFTVLTKLLAKHSDVPVIVVSNLDEEDDIRQALALGVRKYLLKAEVLMDDVVKEVKDVLG